MSVSSKASRDGKTWTLIVRNNKKVSFIDILEALQTAQASLMKAVLPDEDTTKKTKKKAA